MKHLRVDSPVDHCLSCKTKLGGASGCGSISEEGATPEPGDITMCQVCGHIMQFSEHLLFEKLDYEGREYVRLNADLFKSAQEQLRNKLN